MKKFKKLWIALAVLSGLLVFTNPSLNRFKEFNGKQALRPLNFFAFSIFECQGKKYVGILGNFFEVAPPSKITTRPANQKADLLKFPTYNDWIANYSQNLKRLSSYNVQKNQADIRNFYKNLTDAGFKLGDIETFTQKMKDDNIRTIFYNNLTKAGYKLGTPDEFAMKFER